MILRNTLNGYFLASQSVIAVKLVSKFDKWTKKRREQDCTKHIFIFSFRYRIIKINKIISSHNLVFFMSYKTDTNLPYKL